MKMIVRSNIIGINNDEGLKALDGIIEFEADVYSEEELIDLFSEKYPKFRADSFEFVEEK